MTPGEFRRGGRGLTIRYGRAPSPFGDVFVALTGRGVCSLQFVGSEPLKDFSGTIAASWPKASLVEDEDAADSIVRRVFSRPTATREPISVQVTGTNFQIAVWRALLAIPDTAISRRLSADRALSARSGRLSALTRVRS